MRTRDGKHILMNESKIRITLFNEIKTLSRKIVCSIIFWAIITSSSITVIFFPWAKKIWVQILSNACKKARQNGNSYRFA